MTTRKEKFEADRKKMLAQTGREEVKKAEKENYFKENITCEEDYRYNENGEKLYPVFKNQEEKDEHAQWVIELDKKTEKQEKEWEEIKKEIDKLDREEEKRNKKKNENEMNIRVAYNLICWIATLIILAFTAWSFHLFFTNMAWERAHNITGYVVRLVGWIVFSSMTAGMGFFFVSIIVHLLGIFYWKWLGNGMNPNSF